jgi:antitoxin VapB
VLTIESCVDMVIHVRDADTDTLVRELARRKGISITEAIKEAATAELARIQSESSIWDRTAGVRDRISAFAPTGHSVDKQFFDALSGQEGED